MTHIYRFFEEEHMQSIQSEPEMGFMEFVNDLHEHMSEGDTVKIQSLINEIAKYDVFDFIARISSLNLLIENQNKSILFDALIAGLLTNDRAMYTGTVKMSSGKFRNIIGRLEDLQLKSMVDPAENAFIERVLYYGNHWIFPGINYFPSYTLQGFLDALYLQNLQTVEEFIQKSNQMINLALEISDRIVRLMGYNLDSINHIEQSRIKVPDSRLAETMKHCVCLDYSFVEDLMPDESLRQNLFVEFENKELAQVVNGQQQEFFPHPFLQANNGEIILLNPSILASFTIHQLVLLADSYGIKQQLIDAYNNEIWRKCRQDLRNLGHKKIKESEYGITLMNNQHRKEEILAVGSNKLLFVQFICDSGDSYDSHSMFSQQIMEPDTPPNRARAEYFIKNLPFADWENIYQIVILNSFGRSIGAKVAEGEQQYSIHLSPFELHCISVNEQKHSEFLPRYIDAKKKLKMILPSTMVGELNIIENYTSNDYSFYLSDDFDPKTISVFWGFGDSLDYTIRAIKKEDRHLVESYDGEHLCEVVLDDPQRKIYCSVNRKDKSPKFLVKFNDINIWITTAEINSYEEINIYFSILDAISYWLAEAKTIVNNISFLYQTICLHIVLMPPIDEYQKVLTDDCTFYDSIHYQHAGNIIQMIWKPQAYQLFGKKKNDAEKAMIKSLLYELEKLSQSHTYIDTNSIDKLFINPLKKKIFAINLANSPYLAPPAGSMQTISEEEENHLLDEIGEHFLALPEYDYGKVPDENRAGLANQVVGYLYSLLQAEIASIMPNGVYERVCFDLETVMYQIMLSHTRFAYDISCYPEKSEEIINQYNKANQTSIALKFLAEYIAATPPSGDRPLGSMQYDRILAICSLIVDWAYKNDLFRYNIFNTPVEFLKSGRIGMSRSEGDYLASINATARNQRLESVSDPRISTYDPVNLIDDFQDKIDEAFTDEYGFTFQQFTQCTVAIADYGDMIDSDVKRAARSTIAEEVAKQTLISIDLVEKIIDQITLCQRPDFLIPPEPYKKYDVYPWRFNRDLSFTRRPIIQYNGDLIWGNRQLHHMWRYTVDLIMSGKYKARRPKLKQLIGKLSDKRGNDFNAAVAQKLSSIDGLIVREKLSKINGKKIVDKNNNVLGDIDVLYIIPEKRKIVVGEVKDFSVAKNPYEMDQEYKRIFVDGEKPCYMTKHKRRATWIKDHLEDVKAHFNLPEGKWSVKTVMFVSEEIVSNLFYHQGEHIIIYSNITKKTAVSV